jgi:hypothetical protein
MAFFEDLENTDPNIYFDEGLPHHRLNLLGCASATAGAFSRAGVTVTITDAIESC